MTKWCSPCRTAWSVIAVIVLFATVGAAQGGTGQIEGVVRDEQGGVPFPG